MDEADGRVRSLRVDMALSFLDRQHTIAPTDMFWGDRMGTVVDPFGNSWTIATRIEIVPPKEAKKRGDAWMKQMAAKALEILR